MRTIFRRTGVVALVAATALTTSACATDDPAFWDGVALGADITALAIASSYDCTGCRYRYRGHDRHDHHDRPHHPDGGHRPPHGKS